MPDHCQTCKAPIRWTRMLRTGRAHPLDAAPTPTGSVRLVDADAGELLIGPELARARDAGIELYASHFATCPEWRRAGRESRS